mgnify:CR=1 FL=1
MIVTIVREKEKTSRIGIIYLNMFELMKKSKQLEEHLDASKRIYELNQLFSNDFMDIFFLFI